MQKTPLKRKTFLKSHSTLKRGSFNASRKPLSRSTARLAARADTPRNELDKIVSECVRRAAANHRGMAICVTCGSVGHWRLMDCGHYQKRGNTSTRFDPRNLGIQCKSCNSPSDGDGRPKEFAQYIDATFGEGTAEELRNLAREIEYNFPYEEMIAIWSEKLKVLVEQGQREIQY